MELDQEMKTDFINEINQLKTPLRECIDGLSKNLNQANLYEKFGQTIDRIYGTATTLGFVDFGNYCKALKDMTYMCSNTENPIGQKKVYAVMVNCLENLDVFIRGLNNPNEMKVLKSQILIAMKKVETLERSCFSSVKDKKSCA